MFRRPGELANPLVFFAIVISLFPLAVGPETQLLRTLSPGLVWVAAWLAVLLSLDGLFAVILRTVRWSSGSYRRIRWVFWCWPRYWRTGCFRPAAGAVVTGAGVNAGLSCRTYSCAAGFVIDRYTHFKPAGSGRSSTDRGAKRGGILLTLLILPLYSRAYSGSGVLQAALQGLPTLGYLLWMGSMLMLAIT